MKEPAHLRPNRQLDALTWYLYGERAGIAEPAEDACERLVDPVNAFFGTETFSVSAPSLSYRPQGSFRINCACGWSESLLLPFDPGALVIDAPLRECLWQMVPHYETQHLDVFRKESPPAR